MARGVRSRFGSRACLYLQLPAHGRPRMTQLRDESSSESLSKASQPADETSTSATPGPSSTEATSGRPSGTLASTESKKRHIRSQRAPRRGVGLGPWIKAAVHTFIILFALYVWLSWTDPENVEMRRRAWEAAMKRLNKPPVVYANRYVFGHHSMRAKLFFSFSFFFFFRFRSGVNLSLLFL